MQRFRAAVTLLAVALAGCSPGEEVCECVASVASQVQVAKQDLARGDYAAAMAKCLAAEQRDDTNAEAKYCVLLAASASLANVLFQPIMCDPGPCDPVLWAPASINIKTGLVGDVESALGMMTLYADKLAALPDPRFTIADFPVTADLGYALGVLGAFELFTVDAQSALNLRGTWDISEVRLLGAAAYAFQAFLDYLYAHKLVLDSANWPFDSPAALAAFLRDNPNLFAADPAERVRLDGDGVAYRGLRADVIGALTHLAALPAAVKASAAEAVSYPDQVLVWEDPDGDGFAASVHIPALAGAFVVYEPTGSKIAIDTLTSPIDAAAWKAVFAAVAALRDNAAGDDHAPGVDLSRAGAAVVAGLDPASPLADFRPLRRPPPGRWHVDPGEFLRHPKYLGELMPYYFTYTTVTTTTALALAWEEERRVPGTAQSYRVVAGYASDVSAADWAHFDFARPDAVRAGVTLQDFGFPGYASIPGVIAADGLAPDAKTPVLYYIALQDPSFGQFFPGADRASFNAELNTLLRAYCLDFGVSPDWVSALLDSSYPRGNRIADCAAR
jgi:hypothetical protein